MTQAKIQLVTEGWHSQYGVWVKGSAFRGQTLLGARELCAAAQSVSGLDELAALVGSLNGFFAIVIDRGERVLAAVDRIRSIPLFYVAGPDLPALSDSAEALQGRPDPSDIKDVVELEFLVTGYVTGRDTLAPGVKQLQSGECVLLQSGQDAQPRRYFTFTSDGRPDRDEAALREGLERALVAALERLAQWAGGRTIVVPLSGGYDSRLMATLLRQIGYPKVLSYTYGRRESPEVKIALEVAQALGIECRFVEYSHASWRAWFRSPERKAFFQAAHNRASIPHIQDWPAVWHLKTNDLIPEDSVIVPGHTGDLLSGHHIPAPFWERAKVEKSDVVDYILATHYSLWRWKDGDAHLDDAVRARVEDVCALSEPGPYSPETATGKYEAWEYQERQAKFIVNSVRVYDFWGYAWWLPFFDSDVVSYWLTVPYQWRLGARLYNDYVVEKYARAAKVSPEAAAQRAPVRRVKKVTVANAAYLMARKLYHLAVPRESRKLRRRGFSYDKNSLAIFGIMDRETFYAHREDSNSVHSFISKTVLEGDFF